MSEIFVPGESWNERLSRLGIDRDKAEPIHEIQQLRSERIRLMVEVERHRMTEEERGLLNEVAAAEESWGRPSSVAREIRALLDRTAPKEEGNG